MTTLTASTRTASTINHDAITGDQSGIRDPRLMALMSRVVIVDVEPTDAETRKGMMLVDGTDAHLGVQLGRGLFLGSNDDLQHIQTNARGYRILSRQSDGAELHVGVHKNDAGELTPVVYTKSENGEMVLHPICKRVRSLRNGDAIGSWTKFHYALTFMLNVRTFVIVAPTEAYKDEFLKAMEIGFVSEATYVAKRVAKAAETPTEVAAVQDAIKPVRKLGARGERRFQLVADDLRYRGFHAEAARLEAILQESRN